MTARVVLAEDEHLARQRLRDLCADASWLEIVGEASDGRSAIELIDRVRPDLVFLDVRMPEASGIEVLRRIRHRPAVVFTTAYDEYAVTAFELEAVDYLLKPFGRKRFVETLERVRPRLSRGADAVEPAQLAARADQALGHQPLTRLFVREDGRIVPVATAEIHRIEAEDDYCCLHTAAGASHLVSLPLGQLVLRLDPERFLRVHRSHVVNVEAIAEIRKHDDRRLEVQLVDGAVVVASRTGSQHLRGLAI